MGLCCVDGCEVTAEETFYFEFPTSRLLRRKWLEVIPIPGKLPLGTVVCSRHFSEHDYENVRGKVRLKRKVVPSLLLQETKTTTTNTESPKSPNKPTSPKTPTSPKSPLSPASLKSPKSPEIPKSPPHQLDICDSTTVSVPSPVDAEKMIDDIQNARSVQTGTNTEEVGMGTKENGWSGGNGTVAECVETSLPDPKEDIEDMITNYHIKNKVPNPALLADLVAEVPQEQPQHETIEIDDKEAEPVFIEVSVDKDTNASGAGSQDCLMLLESVQVEVDPTTLMLDQDDYEHDEEKAPDKKSDPISLLTSSDEDDVIIQEPHIDTVDVSDETDEDDVPLVKLVKTKPLKKKLVKKKTKTKDGIDNIMWGMYDFYCMKCHFTTTNSSEYNRHVAQHCKSTVLQVCPICGFTSASKSMFSIHKRIHKVDKKFKCHLCDFWTRHKMGLVYHMKNHDSNQQPVKLQELKCWKCGFRSEIREAIIEHVRLCCPGDKRYACDKCDYASNKKHEVNRHKKLRHKQDDDCVLQSVEFRSDVEVVDVTKCADKRHKCGKCDYSSDRRSDIKRHRLRRHREVSDDEECIPED